MFANINTDARLARRVGVVLDVERAEPVFSASVDLSAGLVGIILTSRSTVPAISSDTSMGVYHRWETHGKSATAVPFSVMLISQFWLLTANG